MKALDLLDVAVTQLEAKVHFQPCPVLAIPSSSGKGVKDSSAAGQNDDQKQSKQQQQQQQQAKKKKQQAKGVGGKKKDRKIAAFGKDGRPLNANQPDICKLEFKVGVITKVWVHPESDKLYCEEIDVGEETGPRQIGSGLQAHFTLEQMLGQRLLIVSNLRARNLGGFKSNGMILCATQHKPDGSGEIIEFVEPPVGAPVGEVVTFEGLPTPEPFSGAQVDKKKVFQACLEGMKTTDKCEAAWNGHVFVTSAGPCTVSSIKGGQMR